MRKKILSVLILMLLIASMSAAYVEVGTGTTTTSYVPVYGLHNYSWSRAIYLQSDLVNEMEINSLSYNVGNTPNNYTLTNQTYYMRHTTASSIPSTGFVNPVSDPSFQLVYTGIVTYNGGGWHDLILDAAFDYNGTDNLEVVCHNNHGQWASGYPNFVGTVETPGRVICKFADASFPEVSGIIDITYPNTRFHFTAEDVPSLATLTAPQDGSFNINSPVELTWTNGADTDWVNIYFSANADYVTTMNPVALVANNYTQQSYTVSDLDTLTSYYWRIVAGNNASAYLAPSEVWNFTTARADGSLMIGNGTEVNTHLPMEPYWSYTISQSIYKQEWIDVEDQTILQISYYYNGNSAWTEDVQIYLAHTALSSFAGGASWVLADELVLAYEGQLVVPAEEGWVTLQLTTPFAYNNVDNLLVAFAANTLGINSSFDDFLGSTTSGPNSIYYLSNSVNSNFASPDPGTPTNKIPNILLTMAEVPEGPAVVLSLNSLDFGDVYLDRIGTARLAIINWGTEELEGDISQTGTELSFTPAELTIPPSGYVAVTVELTPEAEGIYNGSFMVNSNDPLHPAITVNTTANILPAFPEGLVVIGDGTSTNQGLPLEAYYRNSYSQSIYYANEIGLTDQQVEKISWHYNGNTAWGPDELKIYMGLTTENSFSNNISWISADEMMEVYAGTITVPNSHGFVEIILDTPFNYTNTQNLVVGVIHSAPSWHSGGDEFYCTPTTETRSILYYGDSTIPDPTSPPTANYMRNSYPNVRLQFGEVPEGPVIRINPMAIDFGNVYLNRTGVLPISIRNIGTEDLTGDFSMTGTTLSLAPDEFTIEPFEFIQVMVSLNPEAEGAYNGSFAVNSNDPSNPSIIITTTGNILPPLPEGLVIIGHGSLVNQGLPLEPWYKHSYSQSIYYANEIGFSNHRIEKISWHYNGNSAWGPDDLKVYMGLTSETTFVNNTSWISATEMMEVYDGNITVPNTDGLIEVILDTPFIYNSTQNLVVGVFHSGDVYHASSDEFYCTPANEVRSILYYGDSIIPNHEDPPTANYMRNSYPNVRLQFVEIPNAPDLTVYPHNVTYELVPVGGSSLEKTLTMRSIGLGDIAIATAPTITGTQANHFSITTDNNTYPLVLSFNEIATIGVSFTPTFEGSKSATVQITGGESRETYTVNLSGYAYTDDGNNQPTDATLLTLPVEDEVYAIMPVGDVDWYKIPGMAIGDILIAHSSATGGSNINTKMWLYGPVTNPANLIPGSTPFIVSGADINHVLPASGDFYLRVAERYVNPSPVNPHTRKNIDGETRRDIRDDTGYYNLFVSAIYNYAYNTPLNLEAQNQSGFVELTWLEPEYERYLVGYKAYRDGAAISEGLIPIGTNSYQDDSVAVGTQYTYYVVGVYEDPDGISVPSNSVTLVYFNQSEPLWSDDFENHPDFTLELPNWIQYDVDGSDTYVISDIEFENQGEPMSYIVFNPASTTPPIMDMTPQSGNKFLASFASTEGDNDDWVITPRITIGQATVVSLYARSYTSDYGLEKFKVKMSLGGDQVADFTDVLHFDQPYLEAPTEWTPFSFDLSILSGITARFAIQCISSNAFILMIDNFRIDSTDDGVDNESVEIFPQINVLNQNYPNPFNPETSIVFSLKDAGNVSLDIYNLKGQKVKTLLNEHREAGTHNIVWNGKDDNGKSVASGVFFYRMKNGKFSSTKKMILLK